MRIIRFSFAGSTGYGLIEGEDVYALKGDVFGEFGPGERVAALDEVRLLAPCQPSKIIALGRNYAEHAAEHGAEVPPEPLIFMKPAGAVIGPGDEIVYPPLSQQVEYEAELAVVIGRRARNVAEAAAFDYILGYTCGNDVTARDLQRRDGQWTRAKGFDTFCPLGPWIVTGLDVGDLAIRSRVNGVVKQDSTTARMVFKVPYLVQAITQVMTLEPGDVIMTGTPAGVGPLQPGDTVEVEVEGIGVLRNTVVKECDACPP